MAVTIPLRYRRGSHEANTAKWSSKSSGQQHARLLSACMPDCDPASNCPHTPSTASHFRWQLHRLAQDPSMQCLYAGTGRGSDRQPSVMAKCLMLCQGGMQPSAGTDLPTKPHSCCNDSCSSQHCALACNKGPDYSHKSHVLPGHTSTGCCTIENFIPAVAARWKPKLVQSCNLFCGPA